ncbi:hypothetical protein EYF80_001822 [Liparis tanakae]|uniref:Uncharacterized protein n=1 Tax=Liparis tanakae TaxID=230148 RepID=A0A4Z2JDX4_9TELE|nr:hypothetical protein EYF80_001822 [Liparis tanakae]
MERLHSAAGARGGGASGSSVSLCGSLPRQAPPPAALAKPARDSALCGPQALSIPAYTHGSAHNTTSSPRPPRHRDRDRDLDLDRDRDRDRGSVRRGSFVERCQELAKGSEAGAGFGVAAGSEGARRSLAVCTELEARFGLRTPTTFSVSPGARHSPGPPPPPGPPPSSPPHRRATPTPPTSPSRSGAPASPRRADATPTPEDGPAAPESPESPDGPPAGPAPGPKAHMNETSF